MYVEQPCGSLEMDLLTSPTYISDCHPLELADPVDDRGGGVSGGGVADALQESVRPTALEQSMTWFTTIHLSPPPR